MYLLYHDIFYAIYSKRCKKYIEKFLGLIIYCNCTFLVRIFLKKYNFAIRYCLICPAETSVEKDINAIYCCCLAIVRRQFDICKNYERPVRINAMPFLTDKILIMTSSYKNRRL